MKTPTPPRGRERGQALIEFSLTLPLFVLLFICVFDLSRAVLVSNVLAGAARDGARFGTIDPTNTAEIRSTALERVAGVKRSDVTVTVTCSPNCDFGNALTVRASYGFRPVTPFLPIITLFGISTMTIE